MTTTPEFTLDWPHGWTTRDGAGMAELIVRDLTPPTSLGFVITYRNGDRFICSRHPNGRAYEGLETRNDLLNADPIVTHEMAREMLRRWWDFTVPDQPDNPYETLLAYITQQESRDAK